MRPIPPFSHRDSAANHRRNLLYNNILCATQTKNISEAILQGWNTTRIALTQPLPNGEAQIIPLTAEDIRAVSSQLMAAPASEREKMHDIPCDSLALALLNHGMEQFPNDADLRLQQLRLRYRMLLKQKDRSDRFDALQTDLQPLLTDYTTSNPLHRLAHAGAYELAADIAERQKRPEEAFDFLLRMTSFLDLSEHEAYGGIFARMAALEEKRSDFKAAEALWKRAHDTDPNSPIYAIRNALLLPKIDQTPQAVMEASALLDTAINGMITHGSDSPVRDMYDLHLALLLQQRCVQIVPELKTSFESNLDTACGHDLLSQECMEQLLPPAPVGKSAGTHTLEHWAQQTPEAFLGALEAQISESHKNRPTPHAKISAADAFLESLGIRGAQRER